MAARLLIAALVAGLAVVDAESPAAPVAPQPREVKHYFPAAVGARLVYECRHPGKGEPAEVVQVVSAVEGGVGGARRVTIGLVAPGGAVYPSQVFEVSARGVYWVAPASGPSPRRPWCMVKLPHDPGQTWDDGAGVRLTAGGPDKVSVPAGEFECIRVEYRDGRSPAPSCIRWFAPGVGEVKSEAGHTVVVLKSFTPGKDRAP